MAQKKGGFVVYMPKIALEELKEIKTNFDLDSNAEAIKKMAKFSKIGRSKNGGGFHL